MNDLKLALRQLLKNPGFTGTAVAVLALGIGANSAIFTLINTFLFKPIVAHEPARLVGVYSADKEKPGSWRSFSYPNFADLRLEQEVFEDVLAMAPPNSLHVTEGDVAVRRLAMNVSANYFSVFGLPLQAGRAFTAEEERQDAPVVIVSDRWWRANGGRPELVESGIEVNGRACTVVGITPRGFSGTTPTFAPDFYLPLSFGTGGDGAAQLGQRDNHRFMLVGRLKPGIDQDLANARLGVVSDRLAAAYPDANKSQILSVATLSRTAISTSPGDGRGGLGNLAVMLQGMAMLVLLVACLNLANMLLARGFARRKEIAIRLALGAKRKQLVGQLLSEGLLLSVVGGACGLVLATGATIWLIAGVSHIIPYTPNLDLSLDWRVIAANLTFCILSVLFFALGPALRISRPDTNHDLKQHSGEDSVAGVNRTFSPRNLLAASQITLSLALLVAAGLFLRGAINAMNVDVGFKTESGFYLELDSGLVGYDEAKARQRFAEILDTVRAVPGVESASLAATIPFGHLTLGEMVQRGGAPVPEPQNAATAAEGKAFSGGYNIVGPAYFATLGIPMLRGREFTRAESEPGSGSRSIIINTALAEMLWPGEDPLGKSLQFPFKGADGLGFQVVGVVPPSRRALFEESGQPLMFVPLGVQFFSANMLHVRTKPSAPVEATMKSVRETVRKTDPMIPVLAMKTLEQHLHGSFQIWIMRMGAVLFGVFAGVALLVSMIGVYGVKSFSVARRTREIGVRMALGARRDQIVGKIITEGLRLVVVGLVVGLVVSAVIAKLLGRFLFEVRPFDPLVFTTAALVLAAAALLACWLPARRAAKVDPMVALRTE